LLPFEPQLNRTAEPPAEIDLPRAESLAPFGKPGILLLWYVVLLLTFRGYGIVTGKAEGEWLQIKMSVFRRCQISRTMVL
jgi:hypothetical protein